MARRLSRQLIRGTIAASLVLGGLCASAWSADSTSHWSSAVTGSWFDAGYWDTGYYPDNGAGGYSLHEAVVDATGATYTVNFNSAAGASLESLVLNSDDATIYHTNGTLAVTSADISAGTYYLYYGTLSGGTWNQTGTGKLAFGNAGSSNVLDGVTVGGDLVLDVNRGDVKLTGGTTWTGNAQLSNYQNTLSIAQTQTIDNKTFTLSGGDDRIGVGGNHTLTLGPNTVVNLDQYDTTIQTDLLESGDGLIINQGTIVGNSTTSNSYYRARNIYGDEFQNEGSITATGYAVFYIRPTALTNTGTVTSQDNVSTVYFGSPYDASYQNINAAGGELVAENGALYLNGDWDNQGTIKITGASGRIYLGGNFESSNIGTLDRSAGPGTVYISGDWDNSAGYTLNSTTGDFLLYYGTITGGTLTQSGSSATPNSGMLGFSYSDSNVLDGVTVIGDLVLANSSGRVRLQNGTTWSGSALLTGSNTTLGIEETRTLDNITITLDGYNSAFGVSGAHTLTLGPSAVVNLNNRLARISSSLVGQGGTGTVINQGTIVADNSAYSSSYDDRDINPAIFDNQGDVTSQNGAYLEIAPTSATNTGAITALAGSTVIFGSNYGTATNDTGGELIADGGTVTVTGDWENPGGTLVVTNGGTLNLGGTFSAPDIGTVDRTGGGTINITGMFDNSSDYTLDATTGDYNLLGGTVTGGTIYQSGAKLGFANHSSNTLDGTTLDGNLVMDISGGDARLQNGASWTGNAELDASNTYLSINDTATIDDTTINLDGYSSRFGVSGSNTLTLGPDAEVNLNNYGSELRSDIHVSGTATIVNQGTIVADNSGGYSTLRYIRPDAFENQGTVTAQNGAYLTISGSTTNTGLIEATAGSTLYIGSGTFVNDTGGQIDATDATLTLTGAWDNTNGTISATNSSVTLDGNFTTAQMGALSLNNSAVTIAGSWDNTGENYVLNGTTGDFTLYTGTITGGTITQSGGSLKLANTSSYYTSNFLDSVTVEGDLNVDNYGDARFVNGAIWTGDATLGYNAYVGIGDTTTLDNSTINLDAYAAFGVAGDHTLTLGPNARVNLNSYYAVLRSDVTLSGTGIIINQGKIVANNSLGTTNTRYLTVDEFVNEGLIHSTNGAALSISSDWTQTAGTLRVDAGAYVSGYGTLELQGGTVEGNGTIYQDINNTGGTISPGLSPGHLTIQGNLYNSATGTLSFELGGTLQGDTYDLLTVHGTFTADGQLELRFLDSFETAVLPTDEFELLLADNPITGSFLNVLSGDRLTTSDGLASFLVYYGASSPFGDTSIVVTGAEAAIANANVPEPASLALVWLGSLSLGLLKRRRRSRI